MDPHPRTAKKHRHSTNWLAVRKYVTGVFNWPNHKLWDEVAVIYNTYLRTAYLMPATHPKKSSVEQKWVLLFFKAYATVLVAAELAKFLSGHIGSWVCVVALLSFAYPLLQLSTLEGYRTHLTTEVIVDSVTPRFIRHTSWAILWFEVLYIVFAIIWAPLFWGVNGFAAVPPLLSALIVPMYFSPHLLSDDTAGE